MIQWTAGVIILSNKLLEKPSGSGSFNGLERINDILGWDASSHKGSQPETLSVHFPPQMLPDPLISSSRLLFILAMAWSQDYH